jgi:two-component system, NarL family, nitrate/nitrite response regulator NarL
MVSSDKQPGAQSQIPNDQAIALTVVVGDDHQVFLDALSVVLGQHNFAVSVARTLPEIMNAVVCRHPDVCLLDRNFCRHDCPDVIRQVIVASPGTKILVLSADPLAEGVLEALRAGASGYLHKTRGITALTEAMSRIQRGEVVVDVPKAAGARRAAPQDGMHRLAGYLTARERQCLRLLVDGLDTAQMAVRLDVSPATVRTHVQSLLTKLGVHSRLEAASLAVRHRLLEDLPAA